MHDMVKIDGDADLPDWLTELTEKLAELRREPHSRRHIRYPHLMGLELFLSVRPLVTQEMNSSGRELAYLLVHLENCSRAQMTVAS